MRPIAVPAGANRNHRDGGRRYRPIEYTFDARSNTLNTDIEDDWEPRIQEQWRTNQSAIRMSLLAEHGTIDGDSKIADFMALGPAPLSIIHEHNDYLTQVRSAFAHGDYYPALVGSCTLGERILNELLRGLLPDFVNHPATTRRVRSNQPITDWKSATDVLQGWKVIGDKTASVFGELQVLRHQTVHYTSPLAGQERELALEAIHLVQGIIGDVFAALGGPPRFIADVAGVSFIAIEAEREALTKRVFLPRCVLVSPSHHWQIPPAPGGAEVTIIDDADYPEATLSDTEFAAAYPAGAAAMGSHLHAIISGI